MAAVDRLYCVSAILAYINGGVGIIGAISFIVVLCVYGGRDVDLPQPYEDGKSVMMAYFACFLVYFLLLAMLAVPLFVGVGKRKPKWMTPYIYLVIAGVSIYLIGAFRHFISGVVHKGPVGELVVSLIVNILCIAIQVFIFWPIFLLYKRFRAGIYRIDQDSAETEPVNRGTNGRSEQI